MTKTKADYIAQEGDIDVYELDERIAREAPEDGNLAERCVNAGAYMSRNCSSAMDFMPSLIKRLDLK